VSLAAGWGVDVDGLPAVLLDEAAELDECRHGIHALWRRLAGFRDPELHGELLHAVLALGCLRRHLYAVAATLDPSEPDEGLR
jgi:hypothetical protein